MESQDQVKVDQIPNYHCLICCGQISEYQILNNFENDSNAADKKEFCERFVTQALKCFNLNLIVDLSWNSNNGASLSSTLPTMCPNCLPVADNFCQIYDQWLNIQDEMEQSKKKIAELMRTAVNSEINGSVTHHSDGLKEFREGVVTNVERKTISGQFLREYFGQAPIIHENDIEVKLEATDMEMESHPGHSQSQGPHGFHCSSGNANEPPVTRARLAKKKRSRVGKKKNEVSSYLSTNKPKLKPRPKSTLRGWRFRGKSRPTEIISDSNSLGSGFKKPNANYPFSCSVCGPAFYFVSWSTCFKHIKDYHKKVEHAYVCYHPPAPSSAKPFRCESCHRTFKSKSQLKSHEVVHSDVKPFMCVICGWSFRREYQCKTHVQTRHGTTWQGNVMNVNDGELRFDRRLSTADEENSLMAEAGNHFLLSLSNDSESENNQNQRRGPFFCRVCFKAFDTEDLRDVHLEMEHGWDPIKIQTEKLSLVKQTEKRFFCNVCGKGFISKNTFTVHEKNHHAVKSIKCGICGWLWASVAMCKRHLKTVHRKNNLAANPFVIRLDGHDEEKSENATVVDTGNEDEIHEEEDESLLLDSKVKVEVELDVGEDVEESAIFMVKVKTEPAETETVAVENQMLEITESENLILPD